MTRRQAVSRLLLATGALSRRTLRGQAVSPSTAQQQPRDASAQPDLPAVSLGQREVAATADEREVFDAAWFKVVWHEDLRSALAKTRVRFVFFERDRVLAQAKRSEVGVLRGDAHVAVTKRAVNQAGVPTGYTTYIDEGLRFDTPGLIVTLYREMSYVRVLESGERSTDGQRQILARTEAINRLKALLESGGTMQNAERLAGRIDVEQQALDDWRRCEAQGRCR